MCNIVEPPALWAKKTLYRIHLKSIYMLASVPSFFAYEASSFELFVLQCRWSYTELS